MQILNKQAKTIPKAYWTKHNILLNKYVCMMTKWYIP